MRLRVRLVSPLCRSVRHFTCSKSGSLHVFSKIALSVDWSSPRVGMKTEFCNKSIRNASSLMYRTSGVSSCMESRSSGQLRILIMAPLGVCSGGAGSWVGDCSGSRGTCLSYGDWLNFNKVQKATWEFVQASPTGKAAPWPVVGRNTSSSDSAMMWELACASNYGRQRLTVRRLPRIFTPLVRWGIYALLDKAMLASQRSLPNWKPGARELRRH